MEFFKKIKSEEDAYWLGIMFAKGQIRSDLNKIILEDQDLNFIKKWKEYINIDIAIKERHKLKLQGGRAKNFYTFEFSSKQTKENLIKFGCVPKKSKILQCPTSEQIPDNLLWHFFRGCIDGDGWITYNTRYCIGLLGTQHFLEVLLTRLRILHYGTLHKKADSDVYEFYITKRELVEKVLTQMYNNSTIYMNRKYNSYLTFIGRSSI